MSYTTIDIKKPLIEDIQVGNQKISQLFNNGEGLTQETVKAFIDLNYKHFDNAIKTMKKEGSTKFESFSEVLRILQDSDSKTVARDLRENFASDGGIQHLFSSALSNISGNQALATTASFSQQIGAFIQSNVKTMVKDAHFNNIVLKASEIKNNPKLAEAFNKYKEYINDSLDFTRSPTDKKPIMPDIKEPILSKLKETMFIIGQTKDALKELSQGTSPLAQHVKNANSSIPLKGLDEIADFCQKEVNGFNDEANMTTTKVITLTGNDTRSYAGRLGTKM